MSDLISRSALLKKIAEEYDLNYGEILINPERFYEMVEEQPTAYDISKVVAELEEEKEISCADFTKYVNEYNPCLQDEAGLTKTFQTWPCGWFHIP